ncbi:AgmX/PglI C-terminal domain-containing protein [Persicimonas caeni]|uniref:AgmX/PglI C-terminal domain-containing protein n=1 Tax=Persicimonas caeni TaxID=2292766 RepID=A0A4Y6PNC7_PERCE|nr:GYF domain-containing protein [Persicimonas caeni]QDG49816.1 AgmX/PglI C-terminal domain-containing protein [Persicimonas caeni]QED31037.1 AgmX/PglI C-terminal domain-containing protein [Persicimonas caeni]
MKFYCDSCNTKYGIADEKVRGKVLKVRCKKCGNVITVREQTVPSRRASDAQSAPPPSPAKSAFDPRQVQWHYSVNGQSFGPFAFGVLEQRFASGELGDECYVWTDSFSDWKPVKQVDAFRAALSKGQQIKPRRKTLGVSQALQAVKPEDFKKRLEEEKKKKAAAKQAESEPVQPERAQPEPEQQAPQQEEAPKQEDALQQEEAPQQDEPSGASAQEAQQEEQQEQEAQQAQQQKEEAQKDRLAKLRARLKTQGDAKDEAAEPSEEIAADEPLLDDSLAADGGSAQAADLDSSTKSTDAAETAQAGQPDRGDDPFESDAADALGPTLPMGDSHEPPGFDEPEDDGENSGLFADFDGPSTAGAATADAQPADADDAEAPDDSDHIPFFPDAPELSSESGKVSKPSKTETSGITGSLLIQLDNIQKEGRGKKVALVAAAILIVGGLTGTAIYFASQVEPEKKVVKKKTNQDDDDELVIRTYSDDEQNKIMMLDSQNVGKEEGAEEAPQKKEPTKVASNKKTGTSKKRVRGPKIKDDGPSLDDAFKSAQKKGSSDDSFRKGLDDGKVAKTKLDSPLAGKSDAFSSLSALSSERSDPIYRPTDTLKARQKKSAGSGGMKLTRKQISQGIRTVRKSVGICRQRHSRRGTPLDARKIYVTLTVEPSGRISAFTLEPSRIRHTEFEKCMNSHRGRWRFPSFDGSSQKMRAPFVLQ